MRYVDSPALDALYDLIGRLYENDAQPDKAMTIAAGLLDLGQERSWAPVWWAYGVIHHDLSDAAYARALDLLAEVDESPEARAAALMLCAEIRFTQAIQRGGRPDADEQVRLLSEAVGLAPDWPSLRIRVARACHSAGDDAEARNHAREAVGLLTDQAQPSTDAFDSAISGRTLDRSFVMEELGSVGLISG